MDWYFCLPPLISNVMVLGSETFRRELGHKGGAFISGISAL